MRQNGLLINMIPTQQRKHQISDLDQLKSRKNKKKSTVKKSLDSDPMIPIGAHNVHVSEK